MNFKWLNTTEEDCIKFNNWNNNLNYVDSYGQVCNNISRFLSGPNKKLGNVVSKLLYSIKTQQSADFQADFCLCAWKEDNLIAFLNFIKKPCNNPNAINKFDAVIAMIAVNPKFQNMGYGTAAIFDIVKNKEKIFGFKPNEILTSIDEKNNPSLKAFKNNNFVKKGSFLSNTFGVYVHSDNGSNLEHKK